MKSNGEPVFLVGEHGQAIIEVIGGPHQENFKCCDQPMGLLLANETDGAKEKHKPQVTINGRRICVKVGENPHPMSSEHSIQRKKDARDGCWNRISRQKRNSW